MGRAQWVGPALKKRRGTLQCVGGGRVCDKVVQRSRERIEIATHVDTAALNLLERRVLWRIAHQAVPSRRLCLGPGKTLGKPEIEQDELPTRPWFEVLRLDVAVDDRWDLGVEIVQSVEQLVGPKQHRIQVEWATSLLVKRAYVRAGNELHEQKLPNRVGKVVDYPW